MAAKLGNTDVSFRLGAGEVAAVYLGSQEVWASLHPEAVLWSAAVTTNGGTASAPTVKAVSDFCKAIDAASIRDRFLRLNLVCGGNLAAARVPLYRGASASGTQYGAEVDANVGPFVSGDYSEATGLACASGKFFDPSLTTRQLHFFGAAPTNVHASVCNINSTNGGLFGGADENDEDNYVGCLLDPTNNMANYPIFSSSGYITDGWVFGTSSDGGDGFFLGEVAAGPTGFLSRNGVDIKDGQNFSLGVYSEHDITPLIFGGVATNYLSGFDPDYYLYGNGDVSAYSVGKAFASGGQRAAFNAAIQAFHTAIGRSL